VWAKEGNREDVLSFAASAEQLSEHPLAQAIITAASEEQVSIKEAQSFNALSGWGIEAEIDHQTVLIGSERLMKGRGIDGLESTCKYLYQMQLLGHTVVLVYLNNKLIGAVALASRVKNDAKQTMDILQKRGHRLAMAPGHHLRDAQTLGEL